MLNDVRISRDAFHDLNVQLFPERIPTIRFDSRAEICCAILMERYVAGWECVPSRTFQVPLVQGCKADFLIHGDLVLEYHPASLHRGLMSDDARRSFERHLPRLKGWLRDELREALLAELHEQYAVRRRILLKATPGLEQAELVVARDVKDFWRTVIMRFCDEPPSCKQLHKEWSEILRAIERGR
jgi:hypothetical protein